MDPATASVIVAAIAAVGGIVGTLISKTKSEVISSKKEVEIMHKENKHDHAIVANLLNKIIYDVNKVDEKIDSHIESHEKGS